jgi:hypothetical protein
MKKELKTLIHPTFLGFQDLGEPLAIVNIKCKVLYLPIEQDMEGAPYYRYLGNVYYLLTENIGNETD